MDFFNDKVEFLIILQMNYETNEITIRELAEVHDEQRSYTSDGQSYSWNSDPDYAKEVAKMLKNRGWKNWQTPHFFSDLVFAVISGERLSSLFRRNSDRGKSELEDFYREETFECYHNWLYNLYPEWFDNDPNNPIPEDILS